MNMKNWGEHNPTYPTRKLGRVSLETWWKDIENGIVAESIEDMKFDFSFNVFGWVWEETKCEDIPFPAKTLKGITDMDVDFLKDTFSLPKKYKYDGWTFIYYRINQEFISSRNQAKKILSRTKKR